MASSIPIKKVYLAYLINKELNKRVRRDYVRDLFKNKREFGVDSLLRDLQNDPLYHYRYFRMDKENFNIILEKIRPYLYHGLNHISPISAEVRLAATLRYLASGDDQVSIALHYRLSPSSMCNIVREVMAAICLALEKEYLASPKTPEDWRKIITEYERKWKFPMCCGSFDGKHIRMKCPQNSGSTFYNYKNFFSVVLLGCVDANYKFTMVDIGACGSKSDGGILRDSLIGKKLYDNTLNLPDPQQYTDSFLARPVFIGDDAFGLKHNFMKGYTGKFLSLSSRVFNYRLSRARMTVENAFGILSARWRIFHKSINANVSLVKLIVKTCVLLHNYLISKGDMNNIIPDSEENGRFVQGNWRVNGVDDGMIGIGRQGSNNASADAFLIRDELRDFFLTNEGKLPWQENYVLREY